MSSLTCLLISAIIAAPTPPFGTSPLIFFCRNENLVITSSFSVGVVEPRRRVSHIPSNFVKLSPGPFEAPEIFPLTTPRGVSILACWEKNLFCLS